MSTHWTERLSEFHDGELSPAEHAECAAHVAQCDTCRGRLQELQAVTLAALADADRNPSTDLWPGILARIEGSSVGQASAEGEALTGSASVTIPFRAARDRASARATTRQFTFSLP